MNNQMRAAALGCCLALAGSMVATVPVVGAPLDKGHFHDEGTGDPYDCDGTPAQVHFEVDGNFNFVPHGSGLAYFRESLHGTATWTNLANGGTYTRMFALSSRDLEVTDNGDGTLTIVAQDAGTDRWYDTNGRMVLVESGQFRTQILIDDGGTPEDPFDDEAIEDSFQILRDTGRNDTDGRDFCADLVTFTS